MNKIILDKYLSEADPAKEDLFPALRLPPKCVPEVPEMGMLPLQQHSGARLLYMFNYKEPNEEEARNFPETFKSFCFHSLMIKEEVIVALQQIKVECNKILKMEIFNIRLPHPAVLEEFRHIEESSISQILYTLKGTWIKELIQIIRNNFS